jgi:hypothetical protein
MNDIDNLTLSLLLNKDTYGKIYEKNKDQNNEEYIKDKKFYKKRVIELTKRLYKNEIKDEYLNILFDKYLLSCINYLKIIDKSDHIQKSLGVQDINIENTSNIVFDLSSNTNNSKNVIMNDNNNNIVNSTVDSSNEIIGPTQQYIRMKQNENVKKLTLDNYVIKKGGNNKKKIVPKKVNFDPKDPALKKKGIKKKKNVTIIYEDTTQEKK